MRALPSTGQATRTRVSAEKIKRGQQGLSLGLSVVIMLTFGTSGAEEFCESPSCNRCFTLFSEAERYFPGKKPNRQRK